jgi:hypothetical protein
MPLAVVVADTVAVFVYEAGNLAHAGAAGAISPAAVVADTVAVFVYEAGNLAHAGAAGAISPAAVVADTVAVFVYEAGTVARILHRRGSGGSRTVRQRKAGQDGRDQGENQDRSIETHGNLQRMDVPRLPGTPRSRASPVPG